MSYGLQVFKADGSLMFDTSQGHRLSRLHAQESYTIATGGSVDISVPGITPDGTWAVIAIPTGDWNLVEITFTTNNVHLYCPGWAAGHSSSILVYRL